MYVSCLFFVRYFYREIVKVDLDGSQISYLVSYIPGVTQLGAMTAYSTDSTALPSKLILSSLILQFTLHIFSFLMYLLESPILNHWKVMLFTFQ